jgi:hypothetical protein
MAATQRAGKMMVKGWPHRLTFCTAPSLLSVQRHWQAVVSPDAWRRHFNTGVSAYAPATNASMAF